jgi:hypothetical protein
VVIWASQLKPSEGTVTASFADNEIWHVLIAADDMKRMNVEQLDDAFRLSLVDASTMVWKAGMKTWQSLGAVAGIEDEPETVVRWIEPPPPPRPLARPAPRPPSPPHKPVAAPASFHTAITPVFAAPLVAPVYAPALQAPDPYVLPKRRVAIPSEVDFRRASGGVRWGRWLVALLLLTGGVLGAYRQNLLREGARRVGIENKYIAGERRVTAFVTAKAPPQVKQVLTRLALLPGPNAAPPPVARATTPAPATPAVAPIAAAAIASPVTTPSEPEVKTVSLDSLPVLGAETEATPKETAPIAAAAAPRAKSAASPVAAKAAPTPAAKRAKATPVAEKPEPVAKAEPKPKAKAEPPPPANENPLKAAIRQAIAADAAKKK